MAFITLDPLDIDAKSPIDDNLMTQIKDNLDDLNSRVVAAGVAPFLLELQGKLSYMTTWQRSICAGIVNKEFTPSIARYALKKSGTSGNLGFDLRYHTAPKTAITAIASQFKASTSSIGGAGTGPVTQSVARATAQISTQTITHAKAAINIQSIINVGGNSWQYNLASALDSDVVAFDQIVVASATSGGNNGTFTITEKGRSKGNNFVVSNPSGAAQTAAAGTVQPKIMSYNFTNPVATMFVAGETALFSSHSNAANNGDFTIYAINQSGNNIWVKNSAGVVQGSAAGTADTDRWQFTYAAAVDTVDFVVGEYAKTLSHTSGANNGNFYICAVNSGGNNIILFNSSGVVQAGAGGQLYPNRYIYTFPTDPSAYVSVGDTIYCSGHTSSANNGTFVVKEVNHGGGLCLTVANVSGVAQGSAVGTVATTKKLVSFASDQSAIYSTASWIEIQGCPDSTYNYYYTKAPFKVLQVNRGGGANYNVVVDVPAGAEQLSPAGYVQVEMKSIFTSPITIAADVSSLEGNQNLSGSSTAVNGNLVPVNTPLMLYITSYMSGDPQDLTVSIF